MKVYEFTHGGKIEGLKQVERPQRAPAPGEVRVGVRAVSLNYRDLMCVEGAYPQAVEQPLVPASDCAGEVLEVGEGVTQWQPGDRVVNTFFHDWVDGPVAIPKVISSFGGNVDGVLAEQIFVPEHRLVRMPANLDFARAATLTCAGTTAWNALFVTGKARPGARVLLLGTGGVSVWALQLAAAAGLEPIVTSSSADKLERARTMGATGLINYRETPEWQDQVMALTNGQGVDIVVEVGGQGTLSRSVSSAGMGGVVAIIGGVSGFGGDPDFSALQLIFGAKQMAGIFVGSRTMLDDLARFVELRGIEPVVDRVFKFDQAAEAYAHLASGRHFGKVVIEVA